MKQFFDHLSGLRIPKVSSNGKKCKTPEIILYAHNGAKYDMHVLMEELKKR
jgi:hypothetical protein